MPQTFEEFISSDLDGLYSAALCFTADTARAEELLQEAAIQAFHQFRARSADPEFRHWMLEILVSTYLRRERRRGSDPLAEEVAVADADMKQVEAAAFPRPGTRAYAWLRTWLEDAWPELDPGDRLVLWLAAIERLRHGRVAKMLGLEEEQVRRRHYRARCTLSMGARRQLGHDRTGRFGGLNG